MNPVARAFAAWIGISAVACIGAKLITGWLTLPMIAIVLCAVLVMLPPSLDPAIQIKERQVRRR